ncbi:MAG TPA: hypothetical protein VGD17_19960 [Chitinophagaceae bacterium]
MRVKDNEFPVVVQAYDTRDRQDLFVAEQVVNSQTEVDTFTSRYAGKLIKVRLLSEDEMNVERNRSTERPVARRSQSSAGMVWVILLLVLVALVVAGFATGWIQQTFGIDLNF